ncbi:MAG: 7-cyano-7-deazaguanine reductase [Thermodesulfobacteriota bacterium]|nr:7-cyano-7-deazaguanine reductase [Thermodesulfobacteriota bacterium]
MSNEDIKNLTILTAGKQPYPSSPDQTRLETFENKYPERDYIIRFDCPEFTSLCPVTGQPDFAKINITYVPDRKCVESKSLKLYLFSYRNAGMFHEEITNKILEDIVNASSPRWLKVLGVMNPRGGIGIEVLAEFLAPGFERPLSESFR